MKKKNVSERKLRDALAKNVSLLEPGLTFIEKEKYIPSSLGTRGFIDLLAQDQKGHFVLIELKRSDAASREAIHELLKYAEGVKEHIAVRDDEIRVIIASTEWRELFIPFSRFVADTSLSVKGIHVISGGNKKLSAKPVEPLKIDRGRFLAPWHELNLYGDKKSLKKGIVEYEKAYRKRGIQNYVLLVLEAPEGFADLVRAQTRASIMNMTRDSFGSASDTKKVDEIVSRMPDLKFILYCGMQMLNVKSCLSILERQAEDFKELKDEMTDMDEEGVLCHLHEALYGLPPTPHRDSYEIGYPAKLSKLLETGGWQLKDVRRYGAFDRNSLLTDEQIIEELCGASGSSKQKFKRRVTVANRAHLSTAKEDVARCLESNPSWKAHVARHLDEIGRDFPKSEVDISIFCPSAGLLTVFFIATQVDFMTYLPIYSMMVQENGVNLRFYYGSLCNKGKSQSLKEILGRYYEGRIEGMLMTLL